MRHSFDQSGIRDQINHHPDISFGMPGQSTDNANPAHLAHSGNRRRCRCNQPPVTRHKVCPIICDQKAPRIDQAQRNTGFPGTGRSAQQKRIVTDPDTICVKLGHHAKTMRRRAFLVKHQTHRPGSRAINLFEFMCNGQSDWWDHTGKNRKKITIFQGFAKQPPAQTHTYLSCRSKCPSK